MKIHPTVLALFSLLVAIPAESPHADAKKLQDEDEVKAQIIMNLPLVASWPHTAAEEDGRLKLCTISEGKVSRYLREMTMRQGESTHLLFDAQVPLEDITGCRVLFLDRQDEAQAELVMQRVAGRAVLTVGTEKDFIRHGGMIGFLSAEKNIGLFSEKNVRFEINLKTTTAAGIVLDPLLLELAEKIIPAGEGGGS